MKKLFVLVLSCLLSLGSIASAAILQLDFGPDTPTLLTNSPYHTESGSVADSSWNVVGKDDVGSGLLYSDGSAATGVSLNLGVSPNTSVIDFDTNPGKSSSLGGVTNEGVFADGSVGQDGIFDGNGGEDNRIGFQITGLAAGIYDVYLVGLNTNTKVNGELTNEHGAFATGVLSTWDTSTLSTTQFEYLDDEENTDPNLTWVENHNYAKIRVTLDDTNPVLSGTVFNANGDRGFLNTVQVVTIPEPGTLVLVGMGLGGLFLFRRLR